MDCERLEGISMTNPAAEMEAANPCTSGTMSIAKHKPVAGDDFNNQTQDRIDTDSSVEPQKKRPKREYDLRPSSLINRIQTERRQQEPKLPKPKAKPPPLSKYRRRSANARERGRMAEINEAFESLRQVIPRYPMGRSGEGKVTKITTLRLALNYISALREMLGYDENYRCILNTVNTSLSDVDVDQQYPSPESAHSGQSYSFSGSDTVSEGRESPPQGSLDSEGESINSS